MKKLLIILAFLLSVSLFGSELLWVDTQVEAIKSSRKSMDINVLSNLKDPFIFLQKEEKKEPTASASNALIVTPTKSVKKVPQALMLSLILNNSAMINNVWYKKGDKINGYNIVQITPKSVLLTKNKKQLLLSTKSSSKYIKLNNE